jgi:hypothetical protein
LAPLPPTTTPAVIATAGPAPVFPLLWLLLGFLLLWSLRRLRFLLRLLVLVLWLSWWWWRSARRFGRCWHAAASAGGHRLGWGYMRLTDHHVANVPITAL